MPEELTLADPQKLRAPRFKTLPGKPDTILPDETSAASLDEWAADLCAATGARDRGAAAKIILESSQVRFRVDADMSANLTAALFADFKPADPLEGLLFGELVACHTAGMEFLRRSLLPEQTPEGIDVNVTRATKLLRTVTAQADVLARLRGKGGSEQRVTVQHVHVSEGGQAIVGNVSKPVPAGGGGRS